MTGQSNENEQDWRPMSEDATLHAMMWRKPHEDGRWCGYHSRLGIFVFGGFPTMECLRDHDYPRHNYPPQRVIPPERDAQ